MARGRRHGALAILAATLMATVMAALAGCGGDTLGAQELRSRATTACATAGRQINGIAMPSSPAGDRLFLTEGVAALRPELTALKTLRPPRALAGTYTSSLGELGQIVSTLDATAAAVGQGSDPVIAFKTLEQQLAPIEAQQNQAWQALGVPACILR
jgi:hypothetical protein